MTEVKKIDYRSPGLYANEHRRVNIRLIESGEVKVPCVLEYVNSKGTVYEVQLVRRREFYKVILGIRSLSWLLGITDTMYPRFLARGWCFKKEKIVLVALKGNWLQCLAHELGHCEGKRHELTPGSIMHPWFFLRGWQGVVKSIV